MNESLIGQRVEVPDHHEGYISRAEFDENQRILARNAHSPRHSILGRGSALTQGLVRCVHHKEHVMSVAYTGPAGKEWSSHQLRCMGDLSTGGRACITIPGRALEAKVVERVLGHLEGPRVSEVRRLWEEERRQERHAGAKQRQHARWLRDELERLGALYMSCPPDRTRVRTMLEQQIEAAGAEIEALERRDRDGVHEGRVGADAFSEAKWSEVAALCRNVQAIWRASTTSARDRKELLRIAVGRIVIDGRDHERIRGRLRWADGAPDEPFEVLLPAYFHDAMLALAAAGSTPAEIAARFDAIGGLTQQGNRWSPATVQRTLGILRKRLA